MHIILQQQPTDNTCASACIAMILGEPVEKIVEEFHDLYRSGQTTPYHFLKFKGLKTERMLSSSNAEMGRLYLLAVPSINKEATLHSILFDTRDDDNIIVYDPNQFKKGMKYYIHYDNDVTGEGQVKLGNYCIDLDIKVCEEQRE